MVPGALQTLENVDELKGKAISLSLSLRRFSHFSSAKTIVESAFSFLLGLLTFQNVSLCNVGTWDPALTDGNTEYNYSFPTKSTFSVWTLKCSPSLWSLKAFYYIYPFCSSLLIRSAVFSFFLILRKKRQINPARFLPSGNHRGFGVRFLMDGADQRRREGGRSASGVFSPQSFSHPPIAAFWGSIQLNLNRLFNRVFIVLWDTL